jgi:hypothetical protein
MSATLRLTTMKVKTPRSSNQKTNIGGLMRTWFSISIPP